MAEQSDGQGGEVPKTLARCHGFPEIMVKEEMAFFLTQGSHALSYNLWVCGYVEDILSTHRGPLPHVYFRESDWNLAIEAGVFLGMG